ncbi:MAG: hypothetical protein H8D34_25785 [Chloroflexi bacterium]|nr:hypothetical protein [Chloroflexota bacterium]MBL7163180.1 hypothetical protein [Anaerolineales bacterium]
MEIPTTPAESGHILDLGDGATLSVLTAGKRGAILLIEWDHFRALLPLGAHENDYETLRMGQNVGSVTVLLLADNGYAPLNPPGGSATSTPNLPCSVWPPMIPPACPTGKRLILWAATLYYAPTSTAGFISRQTENKCG